MTEYCSQPTKEGGMACIATIDERRIETPNRLEQDCLENDSQCSNSFRSQTQQHTQILGPDDVLLESSSFLENGESETEANKRSSLYISPAQQRKIPWGRLSNTGDPTVVLTMLPRAPTPTSHALAKGSNTNVRASSNTTICNVMGLRVGQGDVFNEHIIGRSAKCDLILPAWDGSVSAGALLLGGTSDESKDRRLRRTVIQDVGKRCHAMVSNRHCKLQCLLGEGDIPETYVEDTSGNGTIINSTSRLRKGEKRQLYTGDEICLVNPLLVRSCIHASIQAVLEAEVGIQKRNNDGSDETSSCESDSASVKALVSRCFSSSWRHQVQRLVHINYSYVFVNLYQQHCVPFKNKFPFALQLPSADHEEHVGMADPPITSSVLPQKLVLRLKDGFESNEAAFQNTESDISYHLPHSKSSCDPTAPEKRHHSDRFEHERNVRSRLSGPRTGDKSYHPSTMRALTLTTRDEPTFESLYDVREEIGSGTCGQVRRAIHRQSGEVVAVKIIKLGKASLALSMKRRRQRIADRQDGGMQRSDGGDEDSDMQLLPPDIKTEASILKALSHPYIVKLHDVFVDMRAKRVYLVMELVSGGDLFDRIVSQPNGHYSETSARRIMRRLLSSVVYIHSRGIVHRDLKPENILCSSSELSDDCGVKITDFGLAKQLTDEGLKTFCGTPQYFAPEVLSRRDTIMGQGRYGQEADCWSLGIILYILLCGIPPFDYDVGGKVYCPSNVQDEWKVDFSEESWKSVSSIAKDLVSSLLQFNPAKRISAKAACVHPWILISDGDTHTNPLHDPKVKEEKDQA